MSESPNPLEREFDAHVRESRDYRFNYPAPVDDPISDREFKYLPLNTYVTKPCVEITLAPHQYERLQKVLEFALKDFNHTMVPMTSPVYRVAEQVVMKESWESGMRMDNQILQDLWDQYQTALRLLR